MTPSQIDIWREADLLIRRHGNQAERVALLKANNMNELNDLGGLLTWLRIREALVELPARQSAPLH
jgi:hypothetical protein